MTNADVEMQEQGDAFNPELIAENRKHDCVSTSQVYLGRY